MKLKFTLIFITIITIIIMAFGCSIVFAANETKNKSAESKLVELKEKELSSLEDYEEAYASKSYGMTAYILHKVQIYSIPLCFLGIIIAAAYRYVIGVRHIETQEKGLGIMVGIVTLGVICQVLPLVFTIVVKFGRE